MCKMITADQFLGATFSNMLQKNMYEIELSVLNRLAKTIDKSLRGTHNAILFYSSSDIVSTVDEYCDFFSIKQDTIKLQKELAIKIAASRDTKADFIYALQKHFTLGIPSDINDTLSDVLNSSL